MIASSLGVFSVFGVSAFQRILPLQPNMGALRQRNDLSSSQHGLSSSRHLRRGNHHAPPVLVGCGVFGQRRTTEVLLGLCVLAYIAQVLVSMSMQLDDGGWQRPSSDVRVLRQKLTTSKGLSPSDLQTLLANEVKTVDGLLSGQTKLLKDVSRLQLENQRLSMQLQAHLLDNGNADGDGNGSFLPTQMKADAQFAYAFVVGGVDPDQPVYVHFLYNILVATDILRQHGSTADIVVLFQMSYNSRHVKVTDEDKRLLRAMNIKHQYIPKNKEESFYRITLDKFRILQLVQYSRVIFLDADVMPLRSLDYLFAQSMARVLKPNLVIAGTTEPANAGFFMLQPRREAYERVQELIRQKEERGAALPWPHWDNITGWGHAFSRERDDYFQRMLGKKEYIWGFHCAFSDQGLLYHWCKYEEQHCSIVIKNELQNWGPDANGVTKLEGKYKLHKLDSEPRTCFEGTMRGNPCMPPHDIVHFTGRSKPWLWGPEFPVNTYNMTDSPEMEVDPKYYWYHALAKLNERLNMSLDFEQWEHPGAPPLGKYPRQSDVAKAVRKIQQDMQ